MESSLRKLEEIIFGASTIKLKIPKFQRPYKWESQQIDEFWDDISKEVPSLFLGPVIINCQYENSIGINEAPRLEVVDGQQRLITATILAAVIRDLFLEEGESALAQKIQDRYIAFVNDDDDDLGFRLTTGLSTSEFFETHIQASGGNIESSQPDTKEHKRLKSNYQLLKKKLKAEFSPTWQPEKKKKFLSSIRDKLKSLMVIEIRISNDSEAYEIFERINNYGVDLSLADLLKNHILKKTTSSDDAFETWYELEKTIRDAGVEMKKFIRYHWLSKYGFRTEKELYNTLKGAITNYDSFLTEISASGELYSKLLTAESKSDFEECNVGSNSIAKSLFEISKASRFMSVSQDKVFYLAIARLSMEGRLLVNPKKTLQFIEAFIFKYFAVCNQPANRVERLFSKYAVELQKECFSANTDQNKKANINRIYSHLKSDLVALIPPEEFFFEKFQEVKYANAAKNRMFLKYILGKYENHLSQNRELILNFESINLEHFLPQKPENWNLSRSEIKPYVHNIGNLVMIDSGINISMGNKSLSEKLPLISESALEMNRELIALINRTEGKWDENTIRARNSQIADVAYNSIWKTN